MTSVLMPHPRTNAGWLAVVLAIPLLLFGAYMGMYYAMTDETNNRQYIIPTRYGGRGEPIYRVEGAIVDSVFMPAHEIDRVIRPSKWNRYTPEELEQLHTPEESEPLMGGL